MSMQVAFSLLATAVLPATSPAAPDPTPAQLLGPVLFFGASALALFVLAWQLGWFRGARWSPPRCPVPGDAARLWIAAAAIVCVAILMPAVLVRGLGPIARQTPAGDVVAMLVTTCVYLAIGVTAAAVHAMLGASSALETLGLRRSPVRRPPDSSPRDGADVAYASPSAAFPTTRANAGWVVLLGAPFAIATTMAAASVTQLARTLAGLHQPSAHAMLLLMQRNEQSPWVLVLTIVNATLLAPIVEELLFRGHLQTALTSFFPRRWPAILITSVLFAAMHERWMLPPIFVLSVVIGYLYERTGNLWVAIATHVAFNATSTTLFLISRNAT